MNQIRRFVGSIMACGLALAMVSNSFGQQVTQETIKVVRLKGSARYSMGNNVWHPLKVGTVLKPGALIQTGANSVADFIIGQGAVGPSTFMSGAAAASPLSTEMMSYHPMAEQNVVRLWENSVLSVDKLNVTKTGADVVTDTELDLHAGHVFGTVKKLSAASKYEVKIPNGVAGIRGTIYSIDASGIISVLEGSVVIAYVGSDGTVVTQVVAAGQQYNCNTKEVTPLSSSSNNQMMSFAWDSRKKTQTFQNSEQWFTQDHTIYVISPTTASATPPPAD